MNLPRPDIPLSIQILEAHLKWNKLRHEYDILAGLSDILRDRQVLETAVEGCSISRAQVTVKASSEHENYMRQVAQAKHIMLDAQAKHTYLVNLALEQREEGFHERFQARL